MTHPPSTHEPTAPAPPATPLITSREESDGRITIITLNRPRTLNAINSPMTKQLQTALEAAEANTRTRVIILTGAGKTFCTGYDIKELSRQTPSEAVRTAFLTGWERTFADIHKPVIAAMNGAALGGGFELALLCDILYAAPEATVGLPEINLGTLPGAGGTQRLTSLIGKSKASELILTGRTLTAAQAERLNIVSKVCEPGQLLSEAIELAECIAGKATATCTLAKQAIQASQRGVREGLDIERRLYYLTFGTDAFKEGVSAFLGKRKPNFEEC